MASEVRGSEMILAEAEKESAQGLSYSATAMARAGHGEFRVAGPTRSSESSRGHPGPRRDRHGEGPTR